MSKTIEGGNPGIPAPPDVRAWVHWGDGWAGALTASRIQGYAPSLLDYVDIAVSSDGHLLTDLSVSTIEIGKVDQGAAGTAAWKVDGSGVTQPVSIASMPSTPVTGPLTDSQLRASPVPVSLATLPAVSFASPQHVIVDSATLGSVAVSNFPAGFANTDDITDRAARLLGHVTVDTASGQAADAAAALPGAVNVMAGWDGGNVRTVSVRAKDGVNMLHVADQQSRQYLELLYIEALAQTDILRQLVGERADLL